MIDKAKVGAGLASIIGADHVLTETSALRAYDCDAYTVDKAKPTCIALPNSTEQVAEIVKFCVRENLPFTARGAGTGLSGGSLASREGVIISTKRMKSILQVDIANRCLLAQAGLANKRISDRVLHEGLHFAPDPSSQSVSTLGGNIAENSGGPHTLKYGVTAQHVLGLTMVAPTGGVVHFGGRNGPPSGIDLVSLIVGGEGTLGIVTEAWVKLTPLPKVTRTALISFTSVVSATNAVSQIISCGIVPAALEMMDAKILKALYLAFKLTCPVGTAAMLLVECDGETTNEVEKAILEVSEICHAKGAIEVKIAQDETERERMWMVRKKGIGAMGRIAPSIVTHDGVIPRSRLPEMLQFVYEVAESRGLGVANIFHAGDGNLHPCFYFDDRIAAQVEQVVLAGEQIIAKCIELGGSVTGEHGVGVEKAPLMPLMFSPADLDLQARAKRIFNSGELCNPCKVFPNQRGCIEHRVRSKGMAT